MTPKEQAEQLMDEGMPFARQMLSQYGEFYPFGVALKADGEIQHRDHYCADVYFPYTISGSSVAFGEIFASKRQGVVYVCNE